MTDAEQYAAAIAAELEAVEAGQDPDGEATYADAAEAVAAWAEGAVLDVDATVSLTGGITAVTITRTVGGPGCWIKCYGNGGHVSVRAAWGGEWAERGAYAPAVEAWAWEAAEAWADAHGVRA